MSVSFDKWDFVFLIITLAELFCVLSYPEGRYITKPLIMISLIGYYAAKSSKRSLLFLFALVLAWLGDVFLMFDGFFLWGLGSFLLMQLLYALLFNGDRSTPTRIQWVMAGIVAFVFTGSVYFMIQQQIDILVPIPIYSSIICLMVMTGILRVRDGQHYMWVLVGVISFLISDSVLGYNRFVEAFTGAGFIVMLTYILAQYCIVRGVLQYEDHRHYSSNNTSS